MNVVCTTSRSSAFLALQLQVATGWKGTQPSRWPELTRDVPHQIMPSPQKKGFQVWHIFLMNWLVTGPSAGDCAWLPMHHLFSSLFPQLLNSFLGIVLSLLPSFLAFLLSAQRGFVGAVREEPHGALLPTSVIHMPISAAMLVCIIHIRKTAPVCPSQDPEPLQLHTQPYFPGTSRSESVSSLAYHKCCIVETNANIRECLD